MYAIVELNGKQYQVEEGRYVVVDRLPQAPGEAVVIGNVLMAVDGEQSVLGAPHIAGAQVAGKVLSHFRGPKVLVYKMRCKKGYRRKNGHRQDYTRLQIESLTLSGGSSASGKASKSKKASPSPAEDVAPQAPTAEAS